MNEEEFKEVIIGLNNRINFVTERIQEISDNQDAYSIALGAIVKILEDNNLLPKEE